ncbi:MAG: MazG nucleotide pyrophosphohydrolase domain-containing protein [Ruminococcus sp.]
MNQNNDKRIEKCKAILEHYGFDAQQDKLVEECEELIKAAQSEDYDSFIEELADVSIMISQMVMSLDQEQQEQYDLMIDFKLDRTLRRMKVESDI